MFLKFTSVILFGFLFKLEKFPIEFSFQWKFNPYMLLDSFLSVLDKFSFKFQTTYGLSFPIWVHLCYFFHIQIGLVFHFSYHFSLKKIKSWIVKAKNQFSLHFLGSTTAKTWLVTTKMVPCSREEQWYILLSLAFGSCDYEQSSHDHETLGCNCTCGCSVLYVSYNWPSRPWTQEPWQQSQLLRLHWQPQHILPHATVSP